MLERAVISDGRLLPEELRDKYIFWAIDGVLAPYRINGHIPLDHDFGERSFTRRMPSPFMQAVSYTCPAKEQFAIERVYSTYEEQERLLWLNTYFPSLSGPVFIWDSDKAGGVERFCIDNALSFREVVYIDSDVLNLESAERTGISACHLSSLLDYCW